MRKEKLTRVDFDKRTLFYGKRKDFEQEIDDFVFGGFVDYVKRNETGCYAQIHDDWIPVVDWKDKYEFPGARDLSSLARYIHSLALLSLRDEIDKCRQDLVIALYGTPQGPEYKYLKGKHDGLVDALCLLNDMLGVGGQNL